MKDVDEPCPYCGEIVKLLDERCSHCGERLREKVGLRWAGDTIVVKDMGQILTDDCAMCGAKGAPPLEQEFTYLPWWVYLVILALIPTLLVIGGLIVGLFLSRALSKGGMVSFRACRPCRRKWSLAAWGVTLFVLVGMFAIPALGYQVGDALVGGPYSGGGETGLLAGIVVYLVLAPLSVIVVRGRYTVRCVGIESHFEVSLRFPKPPLLRKLIGERKARREQSER